MPDCEPVICKVLKDLSLECYHMNRISIFILGDRLLQREGLRSLLQFGSDLNVLGEAGNGRAALARVGRSELDAVLIDLRRPICAVDATRRDPGRAPSTHAIVLTRYAENPSLGENYLGRVAHCRGERFAADKHPRRRASHCDTNSSRGPSSFPGARGQQISLRALS